jgi:signal transduction histidine kinase
VFRITARTVLELGSELISSDIIAFYELIKNAFDAKSQTGAEISFRIVLRRNTYLQLRESVLTSIRLIEESSGKQQEEQSEVAKLVHQIVKALDPSAGSDLVAQFRVGVESAETLRKLVAHLDEAYRALNTVEIADTGSGMSLSDLRDNYLTIGTPSRKREVDFAIASGAKEAPFLGEKGIGRLSVMRLGDRLHLETARSEESALNVLDVDWTRFNDIEAMVEDISIAPTVGGKKPAPEWKGTRLIIGDLSEDWTEKLVRELAEYDFARLTDPFVDPKKRPRVVLAWNGTRISIPWMNRTLVENAHALFKGKYSIEESGPVLTVNMEAINLGFKHPREVDAIRLTLPDLESLLSGTSQHLPLSALTSVGPFEFEVYWLNRRLLTGIETIGNQREVRELLRKWSGILLFRDGFRVFPYGDDEDDWLGLDRRALGRTGYVLNKQQFVGHVSISRSENPALVDQTNREGLRHTPEERVFVAVLQHIVRDMLWDFFREVTRQHKNAPLDLLDVKAEVSSLESRARTALTRVRKFVPKEDSSLLEDLQHAFNEFRDLSLRAQEKIQEVEADGRQMVQMAGVGLMVEVVAHELARATESALEALEGLKGKAMPADVNSRLETLRAEMKSVSKRLRVLDQLSVSGRQRSETFDLVDLLNDLQDGHSVQLERHRISLEIKKPTGPFRVKLVKGMVVQILENLLSNSIYWMEMKASREKRFIPKITIQLERNPPTVIFTDNGQGIAPDNKEKVFRPFWSLKEKSKRRGLGLFIARENANYLGGQLTLSDTSDPITGRLHQFILEFPDGSAIQ